MPKRGNVVSRINEEAEKYWKKYYENLFHMKIDSLMQMGQDAAMIAAHDVLQLGPGRARDFCVAYIETMNDMARMIVNDQMDDKEFVYAKAKIDEQIKGIVGPENFQPWEMRYGGNGN